MDRRGFLGMLASLPIIATLTKAKAKDLENVAPNISPNDMPVPSNMAIGIVPHCSGLIDPHFRIIGVIPEEDGTETWIYRNEDGEYDKVNFKTEIY